MISVGFGCSFPFEVLIFQKQSSALREPVLLLLPGRSWDQGGAGMLGWGTPSEVGSKAAEGTVAIGGRAGLWLWFVCNSSGRAGDFQI